MDPVPLQVEAAQICQCVQIVNSRRRCLGFSRNQSLQSLFNCLLKEKHGVKVLTGAVEDFNGNHVGSGDA